MKRFTLPAMSIAMLATFSSVPAAAQSSYRGTPAQRADNAVDRADLKDRIAELDGRITQAQTSQAITRTRASELRRKLTTTRQSYARATRNQGFLSAAESSTYNRTLDAIDAQLPQQ